MKLEALRRSVVRLFRKSDTSVPPKIEGEGPSAAMFAAMGSDRFSDMILKSLRDSGMLPDGAEVRVHRVPAADAATTPDLLEQVRAHYAERPGIQPPLDAGTNGWTWSQWSQWSKEAAGAGTIPGWAFCRFANRLGPESVGFVFGHVRGGFGVWRQPFDVCTTDHDGVEQKSEILTCITHLPSGMGVGIFIDRTTAVLAAELAERVCPGWESDAPERLWSAYMDRTRTAWHALGITESSNAHAHDQHGTRFHIYGQDNESVMAGKPERLS